MGNHQAGLLSWLLAGCSGYEFVNKYKYMYVHSLLEAVRNKYRVVSCRKIRMAANVALVGLLLRYRLGKRMRMDMMKRGHTQTTKIGRRRVVEYSLEVLSYCGIE
jgi:hypothetical protein